MKDAEIQRLQASLQERQADDQSSLIENLRTDLQNMIEKNQRSEFNLYIFIIYG
jgi:septum formation topological specificity factor MinE